MDFCVACNARCATAAKGLHAMKGAWGNERPIVVNVLMAIFAEMIR